MLPLLKDLRLTPDPDLCRTYKAMLFCSLLHDCRFPVLKKINARQKCMSSLGRNV